MLLHVHINKLARIHIGAIRVFRYWHTNTHTCMHPPICTCMHFVHMHIYIQTNMYIDIQIYIQIHVRECICTHYMFAFHTDLLHTCVYTHAHIYIHTHMHAYIHAYIHTYIHNKYTHEHTNIISTHIHQSMQHIYAFIHTHT